MSERALIVGCGRIAGGYNATDRKPVLTHVVAYERLGVPVGGCVDVDAGRARQFAADWRIAEHGTDLPALLQRVQPTVVSLCTPPAGRVALVEAVLAASSVRALLLEKPLAANSAEGAHVVELIECAGRTATVNYFRAFDPCYRQLEQLVASDQQGRFLGGTALYYGPAWSNPPHLLERLIAMLGTPTAVRPTGPGAFAVEFGGVPVYFVPLQAPWSPLELDLMFEHGRLRIVDSEGRVEVYASAAHPQYPEYQQLQPRPLPGPAPSAESLLEAVRAGVAGEPGLGTLRRALVVARVMDAVS